VVFGQLRFSARVIVAQTHLVVEQEGEFRVLLLSLAEDVLELRPMIPNPARHGADELFLFR
jgi:hypothetical protein